MVTEIEKRNLVDQALRVKELSYAPYSKFRVGSAILGKDGRIFVGCNVENASYGLTICAERVALFNAISNGCRDFKAIAIVGDTESYLSPCGACRQVLLEFGENILVIMARPDGNYIERDLKDLIPFAFRLEP